MVDYWTPTEKALLFTELSNKEISDRTGRTESSVRTKRYKETGHYVEKEKQAEPKTNPSRGMSDYYKKARIIRLAEIIGVKLYG